jgi:hypothetical protein
MFSQLAASEPRHLQPGQLAQQQLGPRQADHFQQFPGAPEREQPHYCPNGPTPTFRFGRDNVTGQLLSTAFRDAVSLPSTYYMQLGLRYTFN